MRINYHEEEKLNAISHAIGIIFGILGFYLILEFDTHKTEYSTISLVIYSISIILLFTASTLYHYVSTQSVKMKLRVLDHICIYYLIAGTYTPVALITLEEGNGWLIFYTIWGIAIVGTILKLFFTGKFEVLSLILYLFMGWLIVFFYGLADSFRPSKSAFKYLQNWPLFTDAGRFFLYNRYFFLCF